MLQQMWGQIREEDYITEVISTTDATQTAIASIPTGDDISYLIKAFVQGTRDDGVMVYSGEIVNSFQNDGGTLTKQETYDTYEHVSRLASDYKFDFTVSGVNIIPKVTGKAAENIAWKIVYKVIKGEA